MQEGAALAESHSAGFWRKSSYSGNDDGACCEVALLSNVVLVRDSKHLHSAVVAFSPDAWHVAVASLFTGSNLVCE
ncbi:DUF397 domain-containing protein [Streptomyces chartreusis]